ncbi:hypothetical protein E0689_23770 [Salmonella enterica subsp. enterica serovar Fulica]|nr:hypothetical protein [Salmonella enterica subsp. enterica serovar Fulica]
MFHGLNGQLLPHHLSQKFPPVQFSTHKRRLLLQLFLAFFQALNSQPLTAQSNNLTLRRRPHRSQFLTEQICTLAGIVQPVA